MAVAGAGAVPVGQLRQRWLRTCGAAPAVLAPLNVQNKRPKS